MRLEMELLSDLCSASGENSSGIVDIDICFDELGLPYIPAKRIKGCLREAALELLECKNDENGFELIDKIFGKSGDMEGGELYIGNGYLENYDELRKGIISAKEDKKLEKIFNRQRIQDNYTRIRVQTSIDDNTKTAKENSLRVTRVINKGNKFYFEVKIDDEEEQDLLKEACKVLRSIGLRRTRGFGEVSLSLIDSENASNFKISNKAASTYSTVKLKLRLESPLLISGGSNSINITESYIPGSAFLGYFANRFIKKYNLGANAHEDKDFRRIFLEGSVVFDNAYISDSDYNDFIPCPLSIFKVKNSNDYINLAFIDHNESIPEKKSVRDTYVCPIYDDEYYFISPKRDIEYHHKRPKDRTLGHPVENNGQFYEYEVLSPNQNFLTKISGNRNDIDLIISLIPDDNIIYLGKSKNAQYAQVRIIDIEEDDERNDDIIMKGDRFSIVLLSPMILLNKHGFSEVTPQLFHNKLREHINGCKLISSFIESKITSGFNTKWMMYRQQYNAFNPGSIFNFIYEGEGNLYVSDIENLRLGLRVNEGFGKLKVFTCYDEVTEIKEYNSCNGNERFDYEEYSPSFRELYKSLIDKEIKRRLKYKAIEKIIKYKKYDKNIRGAFLFKITSIINEAESFSLLIDNLCNISIKEKKESAIRLFLEDKFHADLDIKDLESSIEKKFINMLNNMDLPNEYGIDEHFKNNLFNYFKYYYLTLLNYIKLEERKGINYGR